MKTNYPIILFTIILILIITLIKLQNDIKSQNDIKYKNNTQHLNNLDAKEFIYSTSSTLLRQAARYSHAARQDKDILIALLHANYGAGYLFAAKDIFPEFVLISHFPTYKNYLEFNKKIIQIQDDTNKLAVNKCPKLVSHVDILTELGGEGSINLD